MTNGMLTDASFQSMKTENGVVSIDTLKGRMSAPMDGMAGEMV